MVSPAQEREPGAHTWCSQPGTAAQECGALRAGPGLSLSFPLSPFPGQRRSSAASLRLLWPGSGLQPARGLCRQEYFCAGGCPTAISPAPRFRHTVSVSGFAPGLCLTAGPCPGHLMSPVFGSRQGLRSSLGSLLQLKLIRRYLQMAVLARYRGWTCLYSTNPPAAAQKLRHRAAK